MVFGAMIPYNRKTFQPGLSCNVIQQKMTRHPSRKEIAIVSDIFKIYVSFVTDVLTSPESYAFRWSRDWRIWSRRCHPYPRRMIEHRHLGRRTYRRGRSPTGGRDVRNEVLHVTGRGQHWWFDYFWWFGVKYHEQQG